MDSNQHSPFLRSRWASAQLAAAALVVAVVAALSVPSDLGIALTAEHGPVETLQASLLFALAAGVWLHRESVAGSGLHLPLSKTGLSDRQG